MQRQQGWPRPSKSPRRPSDSRSAWAVRDRASQVEEAARESAARQTAVELLSPPTIDRIFEVQSDGIDLVIGILFKFGVGYSLFPTEGRVCAWGGAGGSCVTIDLDRHITFAYVMNKMAPGGGVIAAALAERVKDIVNRVRLHSSPLHIG